MEDGANASTPTPSLGAPRKNKKSNSGGAPRVTIGGNISSLGVPEAEPSGHQKQGWGWFAYLRVSCRMCMSTARTVSTSYDPSCSNTHTGQARSLLLNKADPQGAERVFQTCYTQIHAQHASTRTFTHPHNNTRDCPCPKHSFMRTQPHNTCTHTHKTQASTHTPEHRHK